MSFSDKLRCVTRIFYYVTRHFGLTLHDANEFCETLIISITHLKDKDSSLLY
jgi:hypothetical protein